VTSGVVIAEVQDGSPAAKAGLQRGDVITAFDGSSIATYADLLGGLRATSPGDTVSMTIDRAGQEQKVTVTVGSRTT
jgi:S1-C subfamily serine protease